MTPASHSLVYPPPCCLLIFYAFSGDSWESEFINLPTDAGGHTRCQNGAEKVRQTQEQAVSSNLERENRWARQAQKRAQSKRGLEADFEPKGIRVCKNLSCMETHLYYHQTR
jgi:hypothetical protein